MGREPAGRNLRAPGAREAPHWLPAGLVALVAVAASLAGLGNELVQDDLSLLLESDRLHGLARWREILASAYWPPPHAQDLWRPLTSLLLAAEYGLGDGNPAVFRVMSYLLYAGTAVLVYRLAARFLAPGPALFAGLLFAAHPVHVEAVALAVGQGELLVGVLGTLLVLRYLDRQSRAGGRLTPADWAGIAALYLAAGLAKEHGLVLPLLLLAAELILMRGSVRSRAHLVAGYGVLAGIGLLVVLVRGLVLGGNLVGSFPATPLEGLGVAGRGAFMLQVVPHWVRLLGWPLALQADYSPQEIESAAGFTGLQALGLLLVFGAAVLAWVARRKAPVVTFGLSWIVIALLPVSNLLVPTGIVLAERTLFLPSIGFVLAAGGLGDWIVRRTAPAPAVLSRIGLALAGGVILALGARSAIRHTDWRNDATFRVAGVEDAPRSWRTRLSYASWLFEAGARDSALAHYQTALQYAPEVERWKVRNDLAVELLAEDSAVAAVRQLRSSLSEAPTEMSTRYYLVLALLMAGFYPEARAQADTALARGGPAAMFEELRVWADSASRLGLPPGSIRIRVRPPDPEADREGR